MKITGLKTHYLGTDGKVRLSSVDWWRLENPYSHLAKKLGWDMEFKNQVVNKGENDDEVWDKLGEETDYLITSYIDTPKAYAYMKATAEKHGCKLVMDLDDDIFNVDEMNPSYIRFHPGAEPLEVATKILQDVPIVTTSTYSLAESLSNHRQAPIVVMPNYIDEKVYRYDPNLVPDNGDKIVIGYQGSSTHYSDLMLTGVLEALRRLMIKYPQVHLNVVGCLIDELRDALPEDRVTFTGGERDHRYWVKLWQKMSMDIGIAPLIDTPFNRGKSEIKYYEYSLRKIPGVYSFVEPYINVVRENDTGFLARDEEEWYEKLSWLVENEILRKSMGDRARQDVLDHYTIDKNVYKYEQFIKGI